MIARPAQGRILVDAGCSVAHVLTPEDKVLPVANNARKCEKWDETQTVASQASELQNVSHGEMFAQQQSSLASLEPRRDGRARAGF
jgi:hypothetical protein